MEEAYCVKCRTKKKMLSSKLIKKANRKMMKGLCATCGTKMNKFVGG